MPILSFFNKPLAFTFDQMEVLKNMEIYLRRKGDEEKDPISKKSRYELADKLNKTDGFCHGFALNFLDAIDKDLKSKDKDGIHLYQHFSNLQKIAAWNPKTKIDSDLELVFEKVIAQVHWLQDPRPYHSSVTHSDIEALMEGEFIRDRCYYDIFDSLQSFTDFMRTHVPSNRPILIESSNHATALYRDGDNFYCRDPNDIFGLRKIYFQDIEHVAEFYFEQLKQLYPDTKSFQLPIKFIICRTPEQESCGLETYEEYVTERMKNDSEFIDRRAPDGTNALWLAVVNSDKNAAEILLARGSEPNVCRDKSESSAFEYALSTKQFDVAEMLVTSPKFDANADSGTPLISAIKSGPTKIINELLKPEKKVDLNQTNKKGETALHIAIAKKNDALIKKLLAKGADILHKKEGEKSAFDLVFENCLDSKKEKNQKINDIAMLELLLKESADTHTIREYCFDLLNKNPKLMSEQNPEVAFLLMDKHCSSDLAICIDSFLSKPEPTQSYKKVLWTSMFKAPVEENERLFSKILQDKIFDAGKEADDPKVLNNILFGIIKQFAEQKRNLGDDFKNQLNFATKYLNHCEMLKEFQPTELKIPTK